MSWRRNRFLNGWLLEHWKGTKTSYVLTVPPNYSSSVQNKLKLIPGGTRKFIIIDSSEGKEIYFTTSLSFNEVVKWLSTTFSLQSKEKPKRKPRTNVKKRIDQFTLDGKYIKTWDSISQASLSTGVNPGGISKVVRGTQAYAGNYLWKLNNK